VELWLELNYARVCFYYVHIYFSASIVVVAESTVLALALQVAPRNLAPVVWIRVESTGHRKDPQSYPKVGLKMHKLDLRKLGYHLGRRHWTVTES
jgi:hypothetical protein